MNNLPLKYRVFNVIHVFFNRFCWALYPLNKEQAKNREIRNRNILWRFNDWLGDRYIPQNIERVIQARRQK